MTDDTLTSEQTAQLDQLDHQIQNDDIDEDQARKRMLDIMSQSVPEEREEELQMIVNTWEPQECSFEEHFSSHVGGGLRSYLSAMLDYFRFNKT